jgi:hypothetical protein
MMTKERAMGKTWADETQDREWHEPEHLPKKVEKPDPVLSEFGEYFRKKFPGVFRMIGIDGSNGK